MNYPLISEYIESIKSAEDNFEELSYLRPVMGEDGLLVMTSGNFAVVFKMKDEQSGKFYAVKCFTKEQEGRAEAYREIAKELKDVSSPYLVSIRYLDKELFVDTDQTIETEFPVLLMDWVEGKTLDKYLRENLDDKYALEMLAYRFCQLAQWLIPQPFAHGDLKPDNILVREDGTLVLVDYDGMYVPAMKGQKARELGSPDFRHPLRTEKDFDEQIDDFPLISILLSLKTISLNPLLLDKYGTSDRLLFSVNDYRSISESIVASEIQLFLAKEDCRNIMSIFLLCLTLNIISVSFLKCLCVYFEGLNNEKYDSLSNELKEIISKAVLGDKVAQKSLGYKYYYGEGLPQDYAKAIYWYRASASHGYTIAFYNLGICYQQGVGVSQDYCEALKWFYRAAQKGYVNAQHMVGKYYKDGKYGFGINLKESFKWLIKALAQGCESAQKDIEDIYDIMLLNGILYDVNVNLERSEIISSFELLAEKGNKYGQYNLGLYYNREGNRNEALKWFQLAADQGHNKSQEIIEGWNNKWVDDNFAIYSSDGKTIIGTTTCYKTNYQILNGTENIADYAFCDLGSEIDYSYLDRIVIPSSIKTIGHSPFNKYMSEIISLSPYFEVDNNTLFSNGKQRLIQCFAQVEEFVIPEEVTFIDNHAFYGCKSKKIIISKHVQQMGVNPFIEMDSDETPIEIISLSQKFTVEDNALYENKSRLISYWGKDDVFTVPNGVNEIGEYSFWASKLKTINLPNSIEKIGDCAFWWCFSLNQILAPAEVAEKYKKIMEGYQGMIRIVK